MFYLATLSGCNDPCWAILSRSRITPGSLQRSSLTAPGTHHLAPGTLRAAQGAKSSEKSDRKQKGQVSGFSQKTFTIRSAAVGCSMIPGNNAYRMHTYCVVTALSLPVIGPLGGWQLARGRVWTNTGGVVTVGIGTIQYSWYGNSRWIDLSGSSSPPSTLQITESTRSSAPFHSRRCFILLCV